MNHKLVFLFVTWLAIATFAAAQNSAPSSMQRDPQAAPMQRDQPSARRRNAYKRKCARTAHASLVRRLRQHLIQGRRL